MCIYVCTYVFMCICTVFTCICMWRLCVMTEVLVLLYMVTPQDLTNDDDYQGIYEYLHIYLYMCAHICVYICMYTCFYLYFMCICMWSVCTMAEMFVLFNMVAPHVLTNDNDYQGIYKHLRI